MMSEVIGRRNISQVAQALKTSISVCMYVHSSMNNPFLHRSYYLYRVQFYKR